MAKALMERRHLEFLAQAFGEARTQTATTTQEQEAVDVFIDAIVERLHQTNPRFNKDRFDDAIVASM